MRTGLFRFRAVSHFQFFPPEAVSSLYFRQTRNLYDQEKVYHPAYVDRIFMAQSNGIIRHIGTAALWHRATLSSGI